MYSGRCYNREEFGPVTSLQCNVRLVFQHFIIWHSITMTTGVSFNQRVLLDWCSYSVPSPCDYWAGKPSSTHVNSAFHPLWLSSGWGTLLPCVHGLAVSTVVCGEINFTWISRWSVVMCGWPGRSCHWLRRSNVEDCSVWWWRNVVWWGRRWIRRREWGHHCDGRPGR